MPLICGFDSNLESFFLDYFILQLLFQIQYLLTVELVFDAIFLRQLTQFDLHLDELLSFILLTTMHKELQLLSFLLVG